MSHSSAKPRPRILVVEDCAVAREALYLGLRRHYDVEGLGDAESALSHISSQQRYDVIVLDLGLPGMDGYKFCSLVRANEAFSDIAIIILSGRFAVEDKLMGFSLGAVDFVQKPVDIRELKARIDIHLANNAKAQPDRSVFEVGPLQGNLLTQVISYWDGTNKVVLRTSPLEFKLLHYFLTHVDHVLSRHQLLDRVWGNERNVTDRSVDALISKVRIKLGPYGQFLTAVQSVGYRFEAPSISFKKNAS